MTMNVQQKETKEVTFTGGWSTPVDRGGQCSGEEGAGRGSAEWSAHKDNQSAAPIEFLEESARGPQGRPPTSCSPEE
jgi:hypothetical protein